MPPHPDAPSPPPALAEASPLAANAVRRRVTLTGPGDLAGFRRACRALWSAQIPPERVVWQLAGEAAADPLPAEAEAEAEADSMPAAAPVHAPAAFLALCESAILHRDPGRFGLLYRLLWRLQREPALRHDPHDADRVAAEALAQAVRRDIQEMQAALRFSRVDDDAAAATTHVAWFEPAHPIVEAAAPFFVERFPRLRWAILTPLGSARWDGQRLTLGAPARREQLPPADAGAGAWRALCQDLFAKEMPAHTPMTEPRSHGSPHRPAHDEPSIADADRAEPATLAALGAALQRCRECPIGEHATQAVPGEGPRRVRLMFVGEQPGDQEDLQGRPFVGPAGQLFDRALAALGIDRRATYVTNAVKHFKFELRGKRRIHKTPAQQEAAACQHWLETEIALVDPQALVALGATAARQLMGTTIAVTRERGRWLRRADGRRVLVTLHPSALLRLDPEDKEAAYLAWLADLRKAGDVSPA